MRPDHHIIQEGIPSTEQTMPSRLVLLRPNPSASWLQFRAREEWPADLDLIPCRLSARWGRMLRGRGSIEAGRRGAAANHVAARSRHPPPLMMRAIHDNTNSTKSSDPRRSLSNPALATQRSRTQDVHHIARAGPRRG